MRVYLFLCKTHAPEIMRVRRINAADDSPRFCQEKFCVRSPYFVVEKWFK